MSKLIQLKNHLNKKNSSKKIFHDKYNDNFTTTTTQNNLYNKSKKKIVLHNRESSDIFEFNIDNPNLATSNA